MLQRSPVETGGGTFNDQTYEDVDKGGVVGVNIVLDFDPNDKVDATKIGLTQAVRTEEEGAVAPIGPSAGQRTVKSGPGEGFAIDRLEGQNNPVYGGQILGPGQGPGETAKTDVPGKPVAAGDQDAKYRLGWRFARGRKAERQSAQLFDAPRLPKPAAGKTSSQRFETTALALEGADKDRYYGSVTWGWEIDAKGKFKRHPLRLEQRSTPSDKFLEAAKLWNAFEYAAKLTRPDARGNSTTTAPVEVKIGQTSVVLATGVGLAFDLGADVTKDELLATLPTSIEVVRTGINFDFAGWIPIARIGADNRLTADVRVTGAGGKRKPFTIAKGTRVKRGAVVGDETLADVVSGTLKDLDIELRLAWVDTVQLGRKTADLPIPVR
jgi:hypothetical protein